MHAWQHFLFMQPQAGRPITFAGHSLEGKRPEVHTHPSLAYATFGYCSLLTITGFIIEFDSQPRESCSLARLIRASNLLWPDLEDDYKYIILERAHTVAWSNRSAANQKTSHHARKMAKTVEGSIFVISCWECRPTSSWNSSNLLFQSRSQCFKLNTEGDGKELSIESSPPTFETGRSGQVWASDVDYQIPRVWVHSLTHS